MFFVNRYYLFSMIFNNLQKKKKKKPLQNYGKYFKT